MILEVLISNFFSIKEEIVLDLRAANIQTKQAKELVENTFSYGNDKVVKTLALYGANASGKTNIIKAIRFCVMMIINSHTHNENTIFNFTPFKFEEYTSKPSEFFVRFVLNNIEYEYSFNLNRTQVLKESLYYYPKGRITKIFVRDELKGDSKKDKYSFGNQIIRPLDVAESTSAKTLYLSRASQMDREIPKALFKFFMEEFLLDIIYPSDEKIEDYFLNFKDELLAGLNFADSDIVDFKLEKRPFTGVKFDIKSPFNTEPLLVTNFSDEKVFFLSYHKRDMSKQFDFFTEESAGTIKLFLTLLTVLDVINNNKILLLDEIETHFHPHIVDYILKLFYKSKAAQLIYTTHNTNLLDLKKLRKDQIYFCNKKEDGSTEVYSLYDYSDFRETMDVEKAYLQGRFGAVPYLSDSNENIERLMHEQKKK